MWDNDITTSDVSIESMMEAIRQMDRISGIPIHADPNLISDPNLGEWRQVKFPRSKKKRIRKKWANKNNPRIRAKYWRFFREENIYVVDGHILCHPNLLGKIREAVGGPAHSYDPTIAKLY